MARAALRQADRAREGRGARRGARRDAKARRAERGDATVGDAADPDHRALPLLPRHGDRARREHGAHRGARSCRKGTIAQKERWALPLLTLEKIGAWAITEPGSGSDAFGGMKSTARRDGDGYVLNGSKTFITNGPYADTIVFICKLDDGQRPEATARSLSFILDTRHAGAHAVEAAAQDGPALVADGRAVPRGRARRARPPHRRDRGRAGALGRQGRPSPWSAPASRRWRSASSSSACKLSHRLRADARAVRQARSASSSSSS